MSDAQILFAGQTLSLSYLGNGMAELCFDRQGSAVNKFDAATLRDLAEATRVLRTAENVDGVILSSAKDSFIVGADIYEFPALFAGPSSALAAYNAAQNRVFLEFEDIPMATVSAINGLALGGGFEVTLATDARVIASGAQFGLPEVTLGIFPGYGGTVRLPRIAGAKTAIDWIVSGRSRPAQEARAVSAVDEVVEPAALRAAAVAQLRQLIASGECKTRRASRTGPVNRDAGPEVFAAAKPVARARLPYEPAPLAVIELIERCATLDRNTAQAEETKAFSEIATTPTAQALVQVFINDQQVKKKAKALARAAHPLGRAAVLGAGIMGGGISYTSAMRGVPVIMKDITQSALNLGIEEARRLLSRQVESGRISSARAAAVIGAIVPSLDYDHFDEVDVVVEAIVENLTVKQSVLGYLEKRLAPHAIVTSNTSSLSIGTLASVLERPENFVGMHFFNPVPLMPLVEVVRGPRTSDAAVSAIAGYALTMGKTPIVVRDCAGFLVNRILTAQFVGFLKLLRDGADFARIDAVMEAFGWPMGPARLQDVIGMDTSLHVIETITQAYPDRMDLPFRHAITEMVAQGRKGQKIGVGFYRWQTDATGRLQKQQDLAAQDLVASLRTGERVEFSSQEIIDRMMLPLLLEASLCLDEGIAESPGEIDLSLILGIGFPRHLGGALKYADLTGLKPLINVCGRYAQLGGCYQPSAGLTERARVGRLFYDLNRAEGNT
jgi:3-hydroxyacyl-CoA dehydrogenase / enoyl-CoA hydratase / 3-hydroxybutyryl-CoA epimerase / enoyl-CoA isomerase